MCHRGDPVLARILAFRLEVEASAVTVRIVVKLLGHVAGDRPSLHTWRGIQPKCRDVVGNVRVPVLGVLGSAVGVGALLELVLAEDERMAIRLACLTDAVAPERPSHVNIVFQLLAGCLVCKAVLNQTIRPGSASFTGLRCLATV
jgi:hypothetical protein